MPSFHHPLYILSVFRLLITPADNHANSLRSVCDPQKSSVRGKNCRSNAQRALEIGARIFGTCTAQGTLAQLTRIDCHAQWKNSTRQLPHTNAMDAMAATLSGRGTELRTQEGRSQALAASARALNSILQPVIKGIGAREIHVPVRHQIKVRMGSLHQCLMRQYPQARNTSARAARHG